MTRVSPWYVPGSLENLPKEGNEVPGYRFVFRVSLMRALFYSTHRIILTVDGEEVPDNCVYFVRSGTRIRTTNLVKTDWMPYEGEPIEVIVKQEGGLASGHHDIRIEGLFGGNFGGGQGNSPIPLCAFSETIN